MAKKAPREEMEPDVVIEDVEAPAPAPNHHGGHHDGAYRGETPIPDGANQVAEVLVVEDEE